MSRMYADRAEAGSALAAHLGSHVWPASPVVVALPRGGVPVAAIVARELHAPLDLVIVRKIGLPWHPELALAAVVDGDPPEVVIDEPVRRAYGIDPQSIAQLADRERAEIRRRRRVYLGDRAPLPVQGHTVIVVDDGLATGTSARAALRALRRRAPARLVLAVPVAPAATVDALRAEVDELVCLSVPSPFEAVGAHYADFHQVDDAEVLAALRSAGLR